MKLKPGYRTSEFWFTLVSFLFSGLYLIGIISDNSHKEDLIRDVSHGVESVILIGGQLALLFKYINSRKEIKKEFLHQEEVIATATPKETKNEPTRKSKTRTTKTSRRKPKSSGGS
jgi:hypothetical protein